MSAIHEREAAGTIRRAGAEFVLQKRCFCERAEAGNTGPCERHAGCAGGKHIKVRGHLVLRVAESGGKSNRELALTTAAGFGELKY